MSIGNAYVTRGLGASRPGHSYAAGGLVDVDAGDDQGPAESKLPLRGAVAGGALRASVQTGTGFRAKIRDS